MKLIVGLGNPGKKYANNRHNLGFMAADALAIDLGLVWSKNGDLMADLVKNGEILVIKPQTFMNRSGDSVRSVANFYKVEPKDVLVICDDLDLEFGKMRLAFGGASAGHLGVESVTKSLATADFNRLRIGTGHPSREASADAKAMADRSDGKSNIGVDDYVLSDFLPDEQEKLEQVIKKAVETIRSFLDSGIAATMNRFN